MILISYFTSESMYYIFSIFIFSVLLYLIFIYKSFMLDVNLFKIDFFKYKDIIKDYIGKALPVMVFAIVFFIASFDKLFIYNYLSLMITVNILA